MTNETSTLGTKLSHASLVLSQADEIFVYVLAYLLVWFCFFELRSYVAQTTLKLSM